VSTVMNVRVPYNAGKFLSSCTTGCLSIRAQLHGVSQLNLKSQAHRCTQKEHHNSLR
jgi:hypothetical protein